MTDRYSYSRRRFLATASAAPFIIPSGVLGAPGKPGANDRLTVAHIGIGGMGGRHLSNMLDFCKQGEVNIAAVCEIDEGRLASALNRIGAGCTPYRDYRHVLQRDDIDAVVIATPDHWHALQMVHACETGKHVYVEKPASCTVREGRAMVEAAKKHQCVVQVGSQARSAKPAHQVCTYIRNGMLGKISRVTCWHAPSPTGGTSVPSAPPKNLDWDFWLGPLRWRPYVSGAYHPGSFRWVMESGGGQIRDRGAHVMSIILWCMDADNQTPARVATTGSPQSWGVWDCPAEMRVVYTFKNPDWELVWEQPGKARAAGGFGMVFHGDQAELAVGRDGTRIPADKRASEFKVPAGGVEVYRMDKHDDYNMNHKEDWLQAIKTGKKPCMDIETAHRVANMNNLGNLSYLLGRPLDWDGKEEQIIDDPLANSMLGRPQRHPYHL